MKRLVVLAILGACASTPNLAVRLDPTPPAGVTVETFAARDGTQLHVRRWPATGEPRGVVVIMHGLKDHAARYDRFALDLANSGFSVHAFDLRGHGRSAGPRVAPGRWERYVDDLDGFLTDIEAREPGRPIFLFGHSMGGTIATLVAIRHRPRVAGLILSAPALALDANPLLLAVTRMSGALTPGFPGLSLPNEEFSSRADVVTSMRTDPLIEQGNGPVKTAAGLVGGIERVWVEIGGLDVPLVALHGADDKVTAPWGSLALWRRAPSPDKSLVTFAGHGHALLQERDLAHYCSGCEPPPVNAAASAATAWLLHRTGGPRPPWAGTAIYNSERRLAGAPRGWTEAVEASMGISSKPRLDSSERTVGFTAAFQLAIARPRPVGFHGTLGLRILDGDLVAALRPVGVAARFGGGVAGISGGASLLGGSFAAAGAAWFEHPLGPGHVGASATWDRTFDDNDRGPLGADLLATTLSLRFGGDRQYWPNAWAGVGPLVTGGFVWLGDTRAWVLGMGLSLYGAD
jgi:acylglycerol lipase